jgi:hypothetical protein
MPILAMLYFNIVIKLIVVAVADINVLLFISRYKWIKSKTCGVIKIRHVNIS